MYTTNSANFAVMSWTKSYIYAGARLLSTFSNNQQGGETLEFHHPDRLGTKLVTNNAANLSYEQSTLPFGTALNGETTGVTNQRFTSYDRSVVSSLDYAVNRSYSSAQGRFTSVDPIGMSATSLSNPQSMNLYAYVQNNPIDNIDPSGLNMAGPNTRYGGLDPMGVAYYVDGMLSDGRTAWGIINSGSGWIDYENVSGLDVFTFGSYQNDKWVRDHQYIFTSNQTQNYISLPNSSFVTSVLDQKSPDKSDSCRGFLNKVLTSIGAGITDIDKLYSSLGGNINLNPKIDIMKQDERGNSYFGYGGKTRMIDIGPTMGGPNSTSTFSQSYYARIIFHELLHQANPKDGQLFSHGNMRRAIESVTGQKKDKKNSLIPIT